MKDQDTQAAELRDSHAHEFAPEIADVAYAYWETRGRIDGHDVEDWLAAEQEVLRRHSLDAPELAHKTAIGRAA